MVVFRLRRDEGRTRVMGKGHDSRSRGWFSPAMSAVVGLALAIPGASLAVSSPGSALVAESPDFLPFTPAGADPELAQKVAELVGRDALRFTPASVPRPNRERTVNFAVRVDTRLARTLGAQSRFDSLGRTGSVDGGLGAIAARYNLGIAKGYQSFAQPARSVAVVPSGIRDIDMPDLSSYDSTQPDKPSRFQSRIALEQQDRAGSTPGTLEGAGSQKLDLGGSYRLNRHLDVTAGVRLSQDRDRLAPLTNGVEDDQAVYVGTQIRF